MFNNKATVYDIWCVMVLIQATSAGIISTQEQFWIYAVVYFLARLIFFYFFPERDNK